MTQDFVTCLTWIFHAAWRILTGFYFPGTNITPAAMLLFGALTFIVFEWLSMMLNTQAPSSEDKVKGKKNDE